MVTGETTLPGNALTVSIYVYWWIVKVKLIPRRPRSFQWHLNLLTVIFLYILPRHSRSLLPNQFHRPIPPLISVLRWICGYRKRPDTSPILFRWLDQIVFISPHVRSLSDCLSTNSRLLFEAHKREERESERTEQITWSFWSLCWTGQQSFGIIASVFTAGRIRSWDGPSQSRDCTLSVSLRPCLLNPRAPRETDAETFLIVGLPGVGYIALCWIVIDRLTSKSLRFGKED